MSYCGIFTSPANNFQAMSELVQLIQNITLKMNSLLHRGQSVPIFCLRAMLKLNFRAEYSIICLAIYHNHFANLD